MMGKFSLMVGAGAIALAAFLGAARADVGPSPTLAADGAMFANVSISVADLDRSGKFYQALGFEAGDVHAVPPAIANLLGAKGAGAKLEIRFMKRDGVVLELVHISPTPTKKASAGSAAQLGLAHIAFRVDSVGRFAKIVTDNGGKILESTRTKLGPMEIVFGSDPDGTLMEIAGPAAKN